MKTSLKEMISEPKAEPASIYGFSATKWTTYSPQHPGFPQRMHFWCLERHITAFCEKTPTRFWIIQKNQWKKEPNWSETFPENYSIYWKNRRGLSEHINLWSSRSETYGFSKFSTLKLLENNKWKVKLLQLFFGFWNEIGFSTLLKYISCFLAWKNPSITCWNPLYLRPIHQLCQVERICQVHLMIKTGKKAPIWWETL